jgi:hypothetical protein
MLDLENIQNSFKEYFHNEPFDHCVIKNFFPTDLATELENEFLEYEHPDWYEYNNPLEFKKTTNNWNHFKSKTYEVFRYLNSPTFVNFLSLQTKEELVVDPGLHGGGLHIHGDGGNLNPHLDYSIHPKTGLQRKLNIIIYLSSKLDTHIHGGHLGLWAGDNKKPQKLIKEISPDFNTAIIFDTTQNSWHGLSRPLELPKDIYRKSFAVYYLKEPSNLASTRHKALYYPRENQLNNREIEDIIKKRASDNDFAKVYKTGN